MRALDYPNDNITSTIRRRNQTILFVILAFLIFGLLSSVDFIIKFIETDVENSLFALTQVSGLFISACMAIITNIYPHSVQSFFIKLGHIRENGTKFQIEMWIL